MLEKTRGIRWEIINKLTHQQLIDFLKWKENPYKHKNLAEYSLDQLREIVYTVDKKIQNARKQKV